MSDAVRGSTTIEALMRRHPDGRALALMRRLGWPCAQCGSRRTEPLALAAKRHRLPVRPVIECFRALDEGGPSDAQIERARRSVENRHDPIDAWLRTARPPADR